MNRAHPSSSPPDETPPVDIPAPPCAAPVEPAPPPPAEAPEAGPRLRSSREVYMWMRWDQRFDKNKIVIGYDAHDLGMLEAPFAGFVPDGEIPWHRVWYFRAGELVVWDRRERIDRLDELAQRGGRLVSDP